jgi:hypothetical protein
MRQFAGGSRIGIGRFRPESAVNGGRASRSPGYFGLIRQTAHCHYDTKNDPDHDLIFRENDRKTSARDPERD